MTTSVYHAKREHFRDTQFFGHEDIVKRQDIIDGFDDKSMYEMVGFVRTDDLDVAYQLTNHIAHNWTTNPEVEAHGPTQRSTSIGDILVNDNGVFAVSSVGFELLRAA